MASVHRHPRGKSRYWYCAFAGGDGRRLFRSTKETDRTKARKICDAWAAAAEKARRGELTASASRKILAELVEVSSGETLEHHCVESWLRNWVASKEGSIAGTTVKKYRQTCTAFVEHLGGTRARASLASISPADITKFRDRLLSEGRKAKTVNLAKDILNIPFEAARRQGVISFNPVAAVSNLRSRADGKREAFSHEEISQLVSSAEGDWRGAIILAATSGLRMGDIARLQWSSVDLEAGVLRVTPRKTGTEVVLPIHPDFADWLFNKQRGIGKAPIFSQLAGMRVDGDGGLSNQFGAIVKKAGILRHITPGGGKGRATASKSFHSLRHAFVSRLANSDVASDLRMRLAGHSDAKTHRGYTPHELATLRAAIEKLPSLGGEHRKFS
jgi:integrase